MTAQDNAALVRAMHVGWNSRDFNLIAAAASDDCEWVMVPTGQKFHGQAGIRQYSEAWAAGFPDGKVEDLSVIAGDNGAVIEFVGKGTHTGPLASPAGEIPPT